MVHKLEQNPVHLGLGARAFAEPAFAGMAWYGDYAARHAGDGAEGRLVSMWTFDAAWDSWEMHPVGDEVVVCVAGAITLIQEDAQGRQTRITLGAGDYAINPAGVWHTADLAADVAGGSAQVLFITAGQGTEMRPR